MKIILVSYTFRLKYNLFLHIYSFVSNMTWSLHSPPKPFYFSTYGKRWFHVKYWQDKVEWNYGTNFFL